MTFKMKQRTSAHVLADIKVELQKFVDCGLRAGSTALVIRRSTKLSRFVGKFSKKLSAIFELVYEHGYYSCYPKPDGKEYQLLWTNEYDAHYRGVGCTYPAFLISFDKELNTKLVFRSALSMWIIWNYRDPEKNLDKLEYALDRLKTMTVFLNKSYND